MMGKSPDMFRETLNFVGKRHILTNLVLDTLYVVFDAIIFWGAARTEPVLVGPSLVAI